MLYNKWFFLLFYTIIFLSFYSCSILSFFLLYRVIFLPRNDLILEHMFFPLLFTYSISCHKCLSNHSINVHYSFLGHSCSHSDFLNFIQLSIYKNIIFLYKMIKCSNKKEERLWIAFLLLHYSSLVNTNHSLIHFSSCFTVSSFFGVFPVFK